jgi:hypothetical protein
LNGWSVDGVGISGIVYEHVVWQAECDEIGQRDPPPERERIYGIEGGNEKREHGAVGDDKDVAFATGGTQHRLNRFGETLASLRGGLVSKDEFFLAVEESGHRRLELIFAQEGRMGALMLAWRPPYTSTGLRKGAARMVAVSMALGSTLVANFEME